MNRVYKVIFNRIKGQYEVVPEIAKNGGKAPKRSTGRHLHHSAGILPTAVLLSLLVSGGTCGVASATTIEAGDTISAGDNISVTKDDTGKIVIATDGVATKDDLNQVNSTAMDHAGKISTNTQNIDKNTKDIAENKTAIAANKTATEKNAKDIADNKGAIGKNSAAIDKLKQVNESLGLSKDKSGIKYFRTSSSGADDDAKATGPDALAVGKNAKAESDKTIAIGVQADARGSGAIAIGGEIRTEKETASTKVPKRQPIIPRPLAPMPK